MDSTSSEDSDQKRPIWHKYNGDENGIHWNMKFNFRCRHGFNGSGN
jgi:hypothetical protein